MATIKRTNIAPLNDQLTVTISKADYLSTYETSLKKQAKTANIPGFRKGMVPAGMIKKMYGQSVFTDEVLKKVEGELDLQSSNVTKLPDNLIIGDYINDYSLGFCNFQTRICYAILSILYQIPGFFHQSCFDVMDI